MNIKFIVEDEKCTPTRMHDSDVAFDIRYHSMISYYDTHNIKIDIDQYPEQFELRPHSRVLINTGVILELPKNYYAEVHSRSGLSSKHGIFIPNGPGIIDSGYRGTIGVILYNSTYSDYILNRYDRIAQLIIKRIDHIRLKLVSNINKNTDRSSSGFGSTGS